tara:strand:- start:1884 stop:2684 length:801 start_codon:yes stop_codon:yes gene_type:complete
MKYFFLSLSYLILAYVIVIIFVYLYQRNLLYHPSENNYQDAKIQFNYEEIFIKVDEKIKLKSWIIKKDFIKFKTLVIFHGNAGHLSNRIYKINELNKLDINILLISWRGFSGNKGSPTEKNLYQDAESAIKWLNEQKIDNKKIILYGESLGSGVAIEMAKKNNFNSIILESPFTSIENSAKIYYPYLPVRLLLKDKYDSISKIKMVNTPILIMHGKMDDIVPFSMGKELFEKANNPKYSYFTSDDGHMMEFNPSLVNAIKKFIEKY